MVAGSPADSDEVGLQEAHVAETVGALLPDAEVAGVGARVREVFPEEPYLLPDRNEPAAVTVGERFQKDAIDDAEESRGRPDAKGQGEDGGYGKCLATSATASIRNGDPEGSTAWRLLDGINFSDFVLRYVDWGGMFRGLFEVQFESAELTAWRRRSLRRRRCFRCLCTLRPEGKGRGGGFGRPWWMARLLGSGWR